MTKTFDPLLAAETLYGDIRDAVLTEFKHIEKPWTKLSEDEQQRLITRAGDIGCKLVCAAIDLIAARELPSLPVKVGKIVLEGAECKGSFECYADDENLLRMRHLQGSRAMFVLASPDAYSGEQAPAEPDVVGDLGMAKEPDAQGILAAMDKDGHTRSESDDVRDLPHNKARANGKVEATA